MPTTDKPDVTTNLEHLSSTGGAEVGLTDHFFVVLLVIVCVVAVADFLLGKDMKKGLRVRLEDWWLRLQYVKLHQVALAEAKFCSDLLSKLLGGKFFSIHRLAGSLSLYIASIVIFYSMIEFYRWDNGQKWRLPFTGGHFYTGFPFHLLSVVVSLYVTQIILKASIAFSKSSQYSSVRLFVSLFLLGGLGYVIAFVLLLSFSSGILTDVLALPFAYFFRDSVSRPLVESYTNTMPLLFVLMYDLFSLYWNMVKAIVGAMLANPRVFFIALGVLVRLSGAILVSPIHLAFRLMTDNSLATPQAFEQGYNRFVDLSMFSIRIFLAMFFFISWALIRPTHRVLSLVLLRFAESEKGPLTTLAIALAALAKLVQLLLRYKW